MGLITTPAMRLALSVIRNKELPFSQNTFVDFAKGHEPVRAGHHCEDDATRGRNQGTEVSEEDPKEMAYTGSVPAIYIERSESGGRLMTTESWRLSYVAEATPKDYRWASSQDAYLPSCI
jgi:hypothetical protein